MVNNENEDIEEFNEDEKKAITERIVVDENGMQKSTLINLSKLEEQGIKDPSAFLDGLLDSLNNTEFNNSSIDYIKGYQYGETGKF